MVKVDFYTFSYYMSACESPDPAIVEQAEAANIIQVKYQNHHLQSSDQMADRLERVTLFIE